MKNRIKKQLAVFMTCTLCFTILPYMQVAAIARTILTVSNVFELEAAIDRANASGNIDILMTDGVYQLANPLQIRANGITIKSISNDFSKVILKGSGMRNGISHIFLVADSGFTVMGIAMGEVYAHAIQVQGELGASNFTVDNCRFFNTGEQMLKVSFSQSSDLRSDAGLVQNSLFEYTAGIGPQYYIGGIDAHHISNWVVKNNTFRHIRSPESSLAEHAIHFWSDSTGMQISGNRIFNCDRGIGLGLGSVAASNGVIENNWVHTTRDVGIGLENAANTLVQGNHVVTENYQNSIEARFSGTTAIIRNNYTTGQIQKRDGGQATLSGNGTETNTSWVNGTVTIPSTPSSWAQPGITQLSDMMTLPDFILTDYQANINRRDMVELLVRLYIHISGHAEADLPSSATDLFKDTDDSWVLHGSALELIDGFADGTFQPYAKLTREQAAAIFIRMLEATGITFDDTYLSSLTFPDQATAGDWALRSLRQALRNNILKGDSRGWLLPKKYITREQALTIMHNILLNLDKFPVLALPKPKTSPISLQIKWTKGGAFSSWAETGWYATPALLDVNGDGKMEIIASAYSTVALDSDTGTLLWRAPSGSAAGSSNKNKGRTWPDIVVSDIDADGKSEIVTAHGGGVLSVMSASGQMKSGWPKQVTSSELRSLRVADLDVDGTMEIVVGAAIGSKTNTWVFEHNGILRKGWPQTSDDNGYAWGVFNNNIAIGQIAGDSKLEIVVPSDVHYICAFQQNGVPVTASSFYGSKPWGKVGVWEDLVVEKRGWGECEGARAEKYRPNFAHGPAIIADVDHNGTNEVVVVGNVYDCEGEYTSKYNGLFIFNGDRTRFKTSAFNWESIPIDTGAPLSEDYDIIENCQPDPISADLDNNGLDELLFSSYDGRLHCFSLDKTEKGNWPYDFVYNQPQWSGKRAKIVFASPPATTDVNGDGKLEVIVSTWTDKNSGANGSLVVLDYLGNLLDEIEIPNQYDDSKGNGALASPLVADIDGDGMMEVILNTINSGFMVVDIEVDN